MSEKREPKPGEFWWSTYNGTYRVIDVQALINGERIVMYSAQPDDPPIMRTMSTFLETFAPWPEQEVACGA